MRLVHLLLIGFILAAFTGRSQNLRFVPSSSSGQIISHKFYTLSYIEEHEQAEWVFYQLTKEDVQGTAKRVNSYRPDPSVSSGSSEAYDFKNSGYDRGHLAPAGDMKRSREAMFESFFYSNMSPQVPAFNQGIWNNLEIKVRSWVLQKDQLFIATGPILNSIIDTIGINKVSVPGFYYKVLLHESKEGYDAIAFLLPNQAGTLELFQYAISVDELEKISGIDFWAELPDSIENKIESKLILDNWFTAKDKKRAEVQDLEPISKSLLPPNAVNTLGASNYLQEEVTVCGCVVSSKYLKRSSATYLNLDKKYPNHIFSLTIWGDNRMNFKNEPENFYFGKKVCAKGKVKLLKGVPSINLTKPDEIFILNP